MYESKIILNKSDNTNVNINNELILSASEDIRHDTNSNNAAQSTDSKISANAISTDDISIDIGMNRDPAIMQMPENIKAPVNPANQFNFPGNRPNFPGNQPDFQGNRPNFPGNQPNQPSFPGNQPNFPGNQPNFPGNQPNFPGNQPNFPGNLPSFPNIGSSNVETGANGVPLSAPPEFTPMRQNARAFRVDAQTLQGCMRRFTYIWLSNGQEFWMFPIQLGRNSVSGFRFHRPFSWTFFGVSLNRIDAFMCF